MGTRNLLVFALLILGSLILSACNGFPTALPITPTFVVITVPPAFTTPEPTIKPEPTVSPYPTATLSPTDTPEGYWATPTQIAVEEMLLVRVDSDATDGVFVRTGPGYVCDDDPDPTCNVVDAVFPDDDIFVLLTVDTTFEQAWCEYTENDSIEGQWSACEFLQPSSPDECAIAFDLDYQDLLAPCDIGEAG